MMVLVIETKAQKLLNYDARKTRRKSFLQRQLIRARARARHYQHHEHQRHHNHHHHRRWRYENARIGLSQQTVTYAKSFINRHDGALAGFKSNIARRKRSNHKKLKTLQLPETLKSMLKWRNCDNNSLANILADVSLTKPIGSATTTTAATPKKPRSNKSYNNHNNNNNKNGINHANNNKNAIKLNVEHNYDEDNANEDDVDDEDIARNVHHVRDGSYIRKSSTPLYTLVRLRYVRPRKRRLRKRRKRKYFINKKPPPSNKQQQHQHQHQHQQLEATMSAFLIKSTKEPSLSSSSSSSTLTSTASVSLATSLSSRALVKNCNATSQHNSNDRIFINSKQEENFSNKTKQQQANNKHKQHQNQHQQQQQQAQWQSYATKPATSTAAFTPSNSCSSNTSSRLHSRWLSIKIVAYIFRLLHTALSTLAASLTSFLLSLQSTFLAACLAAASLSAAKIQQCLQLLLLLSCGCIANVTNSTRKCIVGNFINSRHISNNKNDSNICNNNKNNNNRSSSNRFLNGLNKYSWIFLLIYLNLSAKVCLAGYHEKRLLHDLLDPYNTLERPVLNESDPLQLSFGLTLMQIIDVDEKNQLLVTNVWLKLEWNDMNLRWNTSDYGGVKDLRIPPHRIWKPDVLMYNSADEGFDGTYQTNVVVRNNGSCLYVPPGIFKSTCKIDITWFPFDDQRCEMKFGSWTYDGFQLDLQLQDETGGDISSYVLNGEWELLGVPGKRNEIYYNCCPEPYIDITFTIIIRRRTLYYFFNLIIPCVLIASMALLGFTLPPDSGEKLSLGVTILLSLTVFLNMVAETMPATSDAVPLLGTYFNCIMFMVASSVVSTILILNYHHRNADTHEMSEWIRIVFLCWLPWILRMSRPGRPLILEFPTTPCSDSSSERKHQILSDVELKERSSKSLLANVLDIDDDFRHNCRPMTPGGTLPQNPPFYRTVYGQGDEGSIGGPIGGARMPDAVSHHTCIKTATEYELGLILKEIRFITDQLRKEDEDNDIANDWKFAAMVVDRLCLIIFTMFTILATIAVLLSAPHIIVS